MPRKRAKIIKNVILVKNRPLLFDFSLLIVKSTLIRRAKLAATRQHNPQHIRPTMAVPSPPGRRPSRPPQTLRSESSMAIRLRTSYARSWWPATAHNGLCVDMDAAKDGTSRAVDARPPPSRERGHRRGPCRRWQRLRFAEQIRNIVIDNTTTLCVYYVSLSLVLSILLSTKSWLDAAEHRLGLQSSRRPPAIDTPMSEAYSIAKTMGFR